MDYVKKVTCEIDLSQTIMRMNTSNETLCEDWNECVSDPDLCEYKGECVDTIGSYHCKCQCGYVGKNCEGKEPYTFLHFLVLPHNLIFERSLGRWINF